MASKGELLSDEKHAVHAWVHSHTYAHPEGGEGALVTHQDINRHLSGKGLGDEYSPFEKQKIAHAAGHLNSAIAKQATSKAQTVYRGTALNRPIKAGQTLSTPRVTSHSDSRDEAYQFAREGSGKRKYLFEVHAPAGSKMLNVNKNASRGARGGLSAEKEHTFGSHQQFKILSVEERDGIHHVKAHALLDHERVKRPVIRKSDNHVLGSTNRGLKVFAPAHDSYKNLERVRLLGAKPSELGHLAQQAHPNYRAVDHEEASIMHHQRQNFHAARAHQAASEAMAKSEDSSRAFGTTESGKRISNKPAHKYGSGFSAEDHLDAHHHHQAEANGYFQSGNRDKAIEHDELADGHLHAFDGKRAAEGIKKSLDGPAGLGATASGIAIVPAFSSPLQWVYAGMDPRTGIDDAAIAIQAVTPDWTDQDHADHGAAYHELALHFARASPPDDRGPVCAAAAFMHLAACGINPAAEPLIAKSFLVPDPTIKPMDRGQETARKYPSLSADEHLRMAKRHLDAGSTKRALMHIQAAHHVGKQKVSKAGRKPLGAAFSHARRVADEVGGGKKKQREVANRYLKNKGRSSMDKSNGKEVITLRKASRYEGLSGGDLDNLQTAHHDAIERGKRADRDGSFYDRMTASGMHMYTAGLHKQYAPQARDRIAHHLKEARRHAKEAGAKPATRSYNESKDYWDRRSQEHQDRRRRPSKA